MTDLQKKDLVIDSLRDLVIELQLELAVLKRELPTDESTRKKQWDEIIRGFPQKKINNLKLVDEDLKIACGTR